MEVQVIITGRGAYGNKSVDRFDLVRNGKVIGGGLHHKRAFKNEWVVTTAEGMPRFANKADLIASFA